MSINQALFLNHPMDNISVYIRPKPQVYRYFKSSGFWTDLEVSFSDFIFRKGAFCTRDTGQQIWIAGTRVKRYAGLAVTTRVFITGEEKIQPTKMLLDNSLPPSPLHWLQANPPWQITQREAQNWNVDGWQKLAVTLVNELSYTKCTMVWSVPKVTLQEVFCLPSSYTSFAVWLISVASWIFSSAATWKRFANHNKLQSCNATLKPTKCLQNSSQFKWNLH